MTHCDWIESAAVEISAHADSATMYEIKQIIEKHCPLQRDVAHVEVSELDRSYTEGMEDAIGVIADLPMYRSDVGDLAYESGVHEGRRQAMAAIRAAIESDLDEP